ncbi:MAG: hypothetical protein NVSMB23_12300 [Myxococcales bacterium]
MTRSLRCLGPSLCALVLAACDSGKVGSSDEVTIVVQGDRRELEMQEKSLKEREESLHAEQEKLDKRRLELDKVRVASDAEQRRRIDEEVARVRDAQGEVAVQVTAIEAQKTAVAAKKTAIDAPSIRLALANLSAREASVAAREARLAEREFELSKREKLMGFREAEQNGRDRALAGREQQLAAAGPARLDRVRQVPKASSVETKHKKVLADLEARGVLVDDLPADEQPLNAEIWNARRQGDFAHAADLVAELARTVKTLKVDQRFVEAKMVRLQGVRANVRLVDAQRAQVERLLREVTGAYSDGKYDLANKGLNRIAAILDASASPG